MSNNSDKIFIYPTDTVWGIGCEIHSQNGYNRIADIKKTSRQKPLSIMFGNALDVANSFNLPEEVTLDWLKAYFKLETTLGLPLSMAKIKIPKWATGDSNYVSIRCLETKVIQDLYKEAGGPFFTTSLNLTGEPPITRLDEARKFHNDYASDTKFIEGTGSSSLSGLSSTIVFLNENLNFEIKREGRNITLVENHLMKLFQG